MKLFTASITVTGGMFENSTFVSVPRKSVKEAVLDLQEQIIDLQERVHNAAGTADWTKVTITTYTESETKEIDVQAIQEEYDRKEAHAVSLSLTHPRTQRKPQ